MIYLGSKLVKFIKSFFTKKQLQDPLKRNSIPNQNIPRKQLTLESTNELRDTLSKALSEMLKNSCPCHYPRFQYLVNFQHKNYNAGPVFCADSNYLISASRSKDLNFLKESKRITENLLGDYNVDIEYTCAKCSTVYICIAKQYSINFEFEYLTVVDKKYHTNIGAEIIFPIPLLQGLYGFKDTDILKFSKEYRLGTQEELYKYLTESREAK